MLKQLFKPDDYLGREFACVCGKQHSIPVHMFRYEPGIADQLPELCEPFARERRVLILADQRTWEVAGETASESFRRNGWSVADHIATDAGGLSPICDDQTQRKLCEILPPFSFLLAVGSGVINDLGKWIAYERNTPYAILATAASMNGYAAANVAPSVAGVKTLIRARAPVAVFADPAVIQHAPARLTSAGFGDLLAKPTSTADWIMNRDLRGEYYCSLCSDIFTSMESVYLDSPASVARAEPAAIEALFRASVYSGLAMTLVGTSAPASGGEHLLSHTLDMMSSVDGHTHDLHGRQVGLGTIFAATVYERMLSLGKLHWRTLPVQIDEVFWGDIAGSVKQQYERKLSNMETIQESLARPGMWESVSKQIKRVLRSPQSIRDSLATANAACKASDIGCDRDRLLAALSHMHEIRQRPTLIDLAWMCGVLPEAMDEIAEAWLL